MLRQKYKYTPNTSQFQGAITCWPYGVALCIYAYCSVPMGLGMVPRGFSWWAELGWWSKTKQNKGELTHQNGEYVDVVRYLCSLSWFLTPRTVWFMEAIFVVDGNSSRNNQTGGNNLASGIAKESGTWNQCELGLCKTRTYQNSRWTTWHMNVYDTFNIF